MHRLVPLLCVLGLRCVSVVEGASHTSPCMSGLQTTACLQAVKNLMVDQNRFWFGTNFSVNCPEGSTSRDCRNGDRNHLSIMTRLMKNMSISTDSITQVLNVTFQVPAGLFEACGNTYQVEAVTRTLDPAHTTDISLWSANHQPHVQWSSQVNQKYSLIVWDAGALILHGMFYNIEGSNLQNARVAYSYRGPKNPAARDQPYVFLLYTQAGDLDTQIVNNLIVALMSSSAGSLSPIAITETLAGISGPVGVSILTVGTDPFAAGYMKDNRIVNNCPSMLTPAFQALPLAYDVRNVNLAVSVDVTFKSPAMNLTSCCVDFKFEALTKMANPMGNGRIDPVHARHQPQVNLVPSIPSDSTFFLRGDKMHTILMLDVTEDLDPAMANPNTLLHWQVVNMREGNLMTGEVTKSYQVPLPLTDGGTRTFMFLLLLQSAHVTTSGLDRFVGSNCPTHLAGRCSFNMTAFITEHMMKIEGATWFMTSADLYSRSEVIRLGLRSKSAACVGIQGYGDPCPSITCGADFTHAPTVGVLLIAVVSFVRMVV